MAAPFPAYNPPSNQNDGAAAIPVWNAGGLFANIAASGYSQIKTGPGVFQGLGVNTAGTGSAVALYDGVSSPVTITIATPGVIFWPGHGRAANDPFKLTTTGALPTGLTADTTVFVKTVVDEDHVTVSATPGGAAINTSGTQSGVQTAWPVDKPIGTYDTTAQGNLQVGAIFADGLFAIATDGGGAADLTVLYR